MTDNFDPPARRRANLLARTLGPLEQWTPPTIEKTVGPYDLTPFEVYTRSVRDLVERCRTQLAALSDDDVELIANRVSPGADALWRSWRDMELEARRLREEEPAWYSAGFGHSDHAADFAHWSTMPTFSIQEIVCLTIGFEPGDFDRSSFERYLDKDPDKLSAPQAFLVKRFQLVSRTFDPGRKNWQTNPKELLSWIEMIGLDCHPAFVAALRRLHAPVANAAFAGGDAGKPDRREIDSLSKLLTALAIDAYGYRPSDGRSPIPAEIANIMAELGLQLSEDTIRKYLKLGARGLPTDWTPPNV